MTAIIILAVSITHISEQMMPYERLYPDRAINTHILGLIQSVTPCSTACVRVLVGWRFMNKSTECEIFQHFLLEMGNNHQSFCASAVPQCPIPSLSEHHHRLTLLYPSRGTCHTLLALKHGLQLNENLMRLIKRGMTGCF